MGIFNSIKKSRRVSGDIDEKIEYLNKELEKTGLREAMSTSNIYVNGGRVPNENFNDFNGLSHGGYGLGLSGADGNGAGGGIIGTLESPHTFAGLSGVALSPPHPITGVRTNAITITDGTGSSFPLIPGTKSGGNYVRGGALWFFDSNYNFGGQQGRWLNFEWHVSQGSWAFWDTNFLGFYFLNPNLDDYVLNGVNIGTQIKNTIAGINFGTNGEIGAPQTLVLTKNNLDDPGFLPINIDGLSTQGFNYLKDKSRRRLGGRTVYRTSGGGAYPTTGRTTTFTTGSRLRSVQPQPIADPTTTTQTQQPPPENTEPPNIPAPESPPDKPFTTPNPTPPPEPDPIPDPDPNYPGNYPDRGGKIHDPSGLDAHAKKVGYNDELYPLNPNRYYSHNIDLAQDILSSEMEYAFYSAAANGESPNYNTASINKAKANLAKARKEAENWERWKQKTGYTWRGSIQDDSLEKQRRQDILDKDKQIQNELEKLKKDQAQAEADAEMYAAEAQKLIAQFGIDVALTLFGGKILSLAGKAIGKIPAVAKFFKLGKAAQKAQIDDALRAAKTAKTGNLSSALRGATDDIIDNLDDIIMKTDSSQALKFKDALIDAVDAGDEQAIRRIVQQIKNSKFKNQVPTGGVSGKINIPKSKKSEFGRPQGSMGGGYDPGADYGSLVQSYEVKGKLLSEAAKLGHFEPEQLNVNIEDLRKGIMPEFPKDPPPEMVDGYSSKSRLAPKKLERSSFIKITKKDLAKNHRLKDSEIKDFMDQINAINEFIKEHPEELIYAQTRYPKSDPRLAQLNWEMDQKLNASKEYMDKHYPENQKLFKKIQKSIKKNIELTDPKSFKGVKVPKFKGVDLTDFKRRKEVVARHFKKAVRTKKIFSKKKT